MAIPALALTNSAAPAHLWQHQRDAFDLLCEQRAAALFMEMGAGKSATAIALLEYWQAKLALILCPLSVASVWPGQFEKWGGETWRVVVLDKGTMERRVTQIALAARDPRKPLAVVLNYDVLPYRLMLDCLCGQRWDALVMDECLPAGTVVATPGGGKPIENIAEGDVVCGYDHDAGVLTQSVVRHAFARTHDLPLVEVHGVAMTGRHPVWTAARGYVAADDVRDTDILGVMEDGAEDGTPARMRMVPAGVPRPAADEPRQTTPVLRNKLLGQVENVAARVQASCASGGAPSAVAEAEAAAGRSDVSGRTASVPELQPQPVQGPRPGSGDQGESDGHFTQPGLPAAQQRKWAPAASPCPDTRAGVGVDHGVSREHRAGRTGAGVLNELQDRHRGAVAEDRRRGGRGRAQGEYQPAAGRAEGRVPGIGGVDGGQSDEQRSAGRHGSSSAEDHAPRQVFNLETETGNYFAGGLLVHNCHRLKAPEGKKSKACFKLSTRIPRRLALTGTPLPNGPLDIWGQYRSLDPGIFGYAFIPFKAKYSQSGAQALKTRLVASDPVTAEGLYKKAIAAAPFLKTQIAEYRDLEGLHEKMYRIAYRCRTEDVLDLPPYTDTELFCDLAPETMRVYKAMKQYLIAEFEAGIVTADNVLVKLLRLAQIANGFVTLDDAGLAPVDAPGLNLNALLAAPKVTYKVGHEKEDLLSDLLADLRPGYNEAPEPVVVFARFRHDLDTIRDVAVTCGYNPGEISGKRNDLFAWHGGKHDLLAVQLQAGGLGIDLTRARYCVYFSQAYSLGDYDQSRARVRRPGQTRPVTYFHLSARGTVDMSIRQALRTKGKVVKHVVDDLLHPDTNTENAHTGDA